MEMLPKKLIEISLKHNNYNNKQKLKKYIIILYSNTKKKHHKMTKAYSKMAKTLTKINIRNKNKS